MHSDKTSDFWSFQQKWKKNLHGCKIPATDSAYVLDSSKWIQPAEKQHIQKIAVSYIHGRVKEWTQNLKKKLTG